jgi:hypothetical protein
MPYGGEEAGLVRDIRKEVWLMVLQAWGSGTAGSCDYRGDQGSFDPVPLDIRKWC